MDEQLLQRIENLYGIKILSTRKIRDIYQLTTDQGNLCLKEVDYKVKKLLFIYHAMEHLIKQGFRQLPAFIHTLAGDPYCIYNDRVFFLSEWLDGRECDFGDLTDLEMAVVTLAKMHRAAKGFKPPSNVKIQTRLGKWPERFKNRAEELRQFKIVAQQKPVPSNFDRYFLKHVDSKIAEAELACQILAESPYENLVKQAKKDGIFCHDDYVYHNVLVNDSIPEAYIIDFDYCRLDVRMYDLARLIRRVIKKKENHQDLLDLILSTYHAEYPLAFGEFSVLAAFVQFPQRFWRIADRYYNQKRNWSEKKYYLSLKRSVKRQRHQKLLTKEILHYENRQS